jgi:hypothetical protein
MGEWQKSSSIKAAFRASTGTKNGEPLFEDVISRAQGIKTFPVHARRKMRVGSGRSLLVKEIDTDAKNHPAKKRVTPGKSGVIDVIVETPKGILTIDTTTMG